MGKVTVVGGKVGMNAPITGILASGIAVGSTVKLMENGNPVEYLIVHQGVPSSMYDSSCNGTWLLRKNCYEARQWHSSDSNSYKASAVHTYLNSTFLGLFDTVTQGAIRQVKIPYVNGTGSSAVASGADGLSAKVFLLGGYEAGWTRSTSSYFPIDGACLSYFSDPNTADNKRIAIRDSDNETTEWWLRSAYTQNSSWAWRVLNTGVPSQEACSKYNQVRPALILPSNAVFDENTLVLKGV